MSVDYPPFPVYATQNPLQTSKEHVRKPSLQLPNAIQEILRRKTHENHSSNNSLHLSPHHLHLVVHLVHHHLSTVSLRESEEFAELPKLLESLKIHSGQLAPLLNP